MSCTALYAQNRAQTAKPADRMEKCTKVANRLTDKLQLDDRTQQWFVPLYAAYRDTLMGIRRTYRMGKPAGKGQGKQAGVCALNDAEALQCVENALKRDELTLKVKRDYYVQFKKATDAAAVGSHLLYAAAQTESRASVRRRVSVVMVITSRVMVLAGSKLPDFD